MLQFKQQKSSVKRPFVDGLFIRSISEAGLAKVQLITLVFFGPMRRLLQALLGIPMLLEPYLLVGKQPGPCADFGHIFVVRSETATQLLNFVSTLLDTLTQALASPTTSRHCPVDTFRRIVARLIRRVIGNSSVRQLSSRLTFMK